MHAPGPMPQPAVPSPSPLHLVANLAAEEVPFGVVGGTVQAVPEPATVSLLLAGAGVAGWMGRRQRQAGRG